jgi:hypothetical protein
MLAFQVQVNDDAPIRAGSPAAAVLTVIASYVSSRGELEFSIGGLLKPEGAPSAHADWLKRELKVGDRVTLVVVESAQVDEPISVRVDDPAFVEREKRRYYETLKAEYEGRAD